MADKLIERIKADREAGMPDLGGWFWGGGRNSLYLATRQGGRRYIMDFVRKGTRSAQPRFQTNGTMRSAIDGLTKYTVGDGVARGQAQADNDPSVYRMDVCGVDHPDARRIARVPDMEARILADAKIIKAADELADMYDGLLRNVERLQEFNLDGDYIFLKAYRAAVSERDT